MISKNFGMNFELYNLKVTFWLHNLEVNLFKKKGFQTFLSQSYFESLFKIA